MAVCLASISAMLAFVAWLEVLDDDKRHAAVGRHRGEELFQGVKASGRGANANDGEWSAASPEMSPPPGAVLGIQRPPAGRSAHRAQFRGEREKQTRRAFRDCCRS